MHDKKNKNVLVIGLGSMGYGIAQSLIRSGYKVFGQDKNPIQQNKLIEEGGFDTNIPYNDLQAVIIVVLNEKQTRDIILGQDGISEKLKKKTDIKKNYIDGEFEDLKDDDQRKL